MVWRHNDRDPALHMFLGTKAQYIKTAPLLRMLDAKGVDYRLIDSGQHGELGENLRFELGVREPDHRFGSEDINTIRQAIVWSLTLALWLLKPRRLREEVFGSQGGLCVVHGDTPSTFLAAVMARRAGLRVAHLEAGLTSGNWRHPFPEEIIRNLVSRVSDVLFAPSEEAARYLERRWRRRARIIRLGGNTTHEALDWALADREAGAGPVLATMHRVENLKSTQRTQLFVETLVRIAESREVHFVVHGPTEHTLARAGHLDRLERAGVHLSSLLPHDEFTVAAHSAPFVITDGGSIQEECALLGVPTLLWRKHTERTDGLDANVVLSNYDRSVIGEFLGDPERFRHPPRFPEVSPSEQVLEVLLDELGPASRSRQA